MKPIDKEPDPPTESRQTVDDHGAQRRPWVVPAFERMDLREAMGKALTKSDGTGSS
jgi:hypothetical protein